MNMYELHQKMTAHLFPAYSNTDERFLALALAGEVGELCEEILTDDSKANCIEELCDVRIYLELIAKCFDIEGDKLILGQMAYEPSPESSQLVSSLTMTLAIQTGKLCNMIKKRWRDGVELMDECRKQIRIIRTVIEALAKCFGIEGNKLDVAVAVKLGKVAEKHRDRLAAQVETKAEPKV